MNNQALIESMPKEVYERLLQAVETGKWPDGTPLTDEQKETSLQTVMLYQSKVLKSDEHMTLNAEGEIVHKSKYQLKQEFSDSQSIARFKQDDF
ncbi:MAG: DUF1315 family protein [Alteromonadaceae bacterium]|nr:DUF1315 family protein [Alteromonadaceae bacterium]